MQQKLDISGQEVWALEAKVHHMGRQSVMPT